jgi:hypothetical protein
MIYLGDYLLTLPSLENKFRLVRGSMCERFRLFVIGALIQLMA